MTIAAPSSSAETDTFVGDLNHNQADASERSYDKQTLFAPVKSITKIPADAAQCNPAQEPDVAPRAKINISLKKKSKSSSSNHQKSTSTASNLLANEYTTIAEEADIISKRRQEEGTVLIIPCNQSKSECESDGHQNKQPLLAGRLASLRMQQSERRTNHGIRGVEKAEDITNVVGVEDTGTGRNSSIDAPLDDEAVMNQLIQSAEQSKQSNTRTTTSTTGGSKRGLVIAAPTQNKLIIARRKTDDAAKVTHDGMQQDEIEMINDDELFKQELSHHAADVEPTSNVYANVAIHDFGSALLRGMGWTGGPESSKGDETQAIKPRPHRLGLGATPLLPAPTASGEKGLSGRASNGTGGLIHRRARRPDEVKRDKDLRRRQQEAEKREEEKKRLDVQHTLQKGSIVHVISQDSDSTRGQGQKNSSISSDVNGRALVIRTTGVPGLNRILIQMEGSLLETSVTKHSVSLCSWKELEMNPYETNPMRSQPDTQKTDHRLQKMLDVKGETLARGDARTSTKSYYKEDQRRKRNDHDHRSRSRSGSREKSSKRRKETSALRGHRDDERYIRSQSRSSVKEEYSSSHHRQYPKDSRSSNQNQQQLHWLTPNIRVRLISKKIPKYYLQKGVVQDVLRSSSRDHGDGAPKATLLMDSGQVLDKVPERYLETALPKTGGNVIILEGTEAVRWKLGRLLDRSSKDGQATIQLEDDLDVVRVSLDSIAEWCG